jgi:RecB family exonuclease
VPSYYAFEAHRAAGGPDIDVRQFEERARAGTETKIGWPAPADPAKAIDDLEFDLATLAPRSKGSGLYLKKLPGRAVDALRTRWVRWHKPWKAADGLFVEEIGSDALKAYLLTAKSWSASGLQQYAKCPYRFALAGIFGLRPEERPSAIQRMDPAIRGEIFHEVQCRVLRGDGELEAVLREVTERWREDLAPAIPQVWESEVRSMAADLHGWWERRAEDWTAVAEEMEFDVAIEEGFRLKGAIDLVERHASGLVRVVDHKTGRIPDPRPETVGGGEYLQPTLYAMAAEVVLKEGVAAGQLYYATVAQNYEVISVDLRIARRRAMEVLKTIDHALRDGFFPAAPRKDACKRCDYLPVCGPYEEERVAEKSQVELGRLKELRSWR